MKLKNIRIKNYRGIKNTEIDLAEDINVFVGINGSGKTTILDAIAISLSWLVNRIEHENVSGRHILEKDIKNETSFSSVELTIKENKKTYSWKLVKTDKGYRSKEKSQLTEVSTLATYFQQILLDKSKLPVIVYYPINRIVADFPVRSSMNNFNIINVYDEALAGKINYDSFFNWLKERDDIINEKIGSRYNWMIQNKTWLKKRIKKILSYFEECITTTRNAA